jgi:choline dehydrogenase
MYVPRGKVLGGSSSINGMAYVRGNRGDFDHWAELGNEGWSFRDCEACFRRLEDFTGTGGAGRGVGGPIGVTVAPAAESMSPIGQALMTAGAQVGYPINGDYNGLSQEGFAPAQAAIKDGRRQSTSATYLAAAINRRNLEVITNALVTRVLVRRGRAVGVEYVRQGRKHIVETDGEVLLAGGAVNSPQLLQLSGIGPAQLLASHGISVEQDLAGVGENLQDHLYVGVKQEITKPYSALRHLNPVRGMLGLAQYLLFHNGPALSSGNEVLAFLKSHQGIDRPDVQFHFTLLMYEDHGRTIIRREGFSAVGTQLRPLSRGRVTIASANPAQAPLIDPNYLSHPEDVRVLRESIRMARAIIAQSAFDDFRGAEYAPGAGVQSESDLDAYIRATATSVYHLVGTCKMGSDPLAVVDSRLKVHGVDGLRVIDASIMPTIVSGNTFAASVMIAERAAQFILAGATLERSTVA